MNKRLRCHGSGLTHSASRLYHFLGAIILWSQPCSFSLSRPWKSILETFCSKFSLQKLVTKLGWTHLRPPPVSEQKIPGLCTPESCGHHCIHIDGHPCKTLETCLRFQKSDPCCFRNSIPRKDVVSQRQDEPIQNYTLKHLDMKEYQRSTLPETNISPENSWLEYNHFLLGPAYFQAGLRDYSVTFGWLVDPCWSWNKRWVEGNGLIP